MIVLVGKTTAASTAVAAEIQQAKRANVPFFGVFVDEVTGLPEGLPETRAVPWDWPRITAAINQLMHEGKNYTFA
jgi:hypothetical protein